MLEYRISNVPPVKEKTGVDSIKAVRTDLIQDYCSEKRDLSIERVSVLNTGWASRNLHPTSRVGLENKKINRRNIKRKGDSG